jgi:hypothetical protein
VANPITLQEDILALGSSLINETITDSVSAILKTQEAWAGVIANYINTIIIVPTDVLSQFGVEIDLVSTEVIYSSVFSGMQAGGFISISNDAESFASGLFHGFDAGALTLSANIALSTGSIIIATPPTVIAAEASKLAITTAMLLLPSAETFASIISSSIDTYARTGIYVAAAASPVIWS